MVPAAKIPPIFLTDTLKIDYTLVNLRKGKPTATWGRKALGPALEVEGRDSRAAERRTGIFYVNIS